MLKFSRLKIAWVLLLMMGCQTYPSKPLIPKDSLKKVERERELPLRAKVESHPSGKKDPQEATLQSAEWKFTFLNAIQLLAKSPRLAEARSEYKKAFFFSSLKTPYPNPEMELGFLVGSNLGEAQSKRVQPLIAFGFTIPTGGRLIQQDQLNETLAEYAYLKYWLLHRKHYLHFRGLYLFLALLQKQTGAYQDLIQSVENALAVTKKLAEAGSAVSLDVGLMELELIQKKTDRMDIEKEIIEIQGEIAQLLGVTEKSFSEIATIQLPELPTPIPTIESLKKTLLANHPTLALLRATYEIAEKELFLEMAKRNLDITLSPSFVGDPGDDKQIWGLSLTIPLPIFDQNKQAIASKEGQRELIETRYQSTLNEALAVLEQSYHLYVHHQQKLSSMKEILLPRAQKNVLIAKESVHRGEIDFLKYLETERALRKIILDIHATELLMYKSWLKIEEVLGLPLAFFAEEQNQSVALPFQMDEPTGKSILQTLPRHQSGE